MIRVIQIRNERLFRGLSPLGFWIFVQSSFTRVEIESGLRLYQA